MAPKRAAAPFLRSALVPALLFATLFAPTPARALRVVNYNIMFYPSVNVSGRNPYFRTVMGALNVDVITVQELNSPAGVDSFRNNVLNVLEPGQWASAPYSNGPDSNNGLFYRTSKLELLGSWFWLPPDNLRHVNVYRLRPIGYANTEFRIYSLHLKAGNTSGDEQRRLTDAISIRDSMNNVPPGTHSIVTGDFNVYKGNDLCLDRFALDMLDDDGRVYDPLNLLGPVSWQDNASMALYHTQCPSTSAYRPSGSYSGGGIDDRFDLFLPTYNWNDGEGLDIVPGTYATVGNDGLHLNKSVTDAPIAPADTAYARALWWASDHMPIRMDIQLPSRMLVAGGPLAFGTAIVGATVGGDIQVSNPAAAPADELNYSLAAPPGFAVAGGPFLNAPESSANPHTISMDTATPGVKSGDLVVTSDAPDAPTSNVALSGTVLRHGAASLDSLVAAAAATLDFGVQDPGLFGTVEARAHNLGWDALQARLNVSAATITGGDGRFTIVDGVAPVLLSGVGQTWTIAFDDAGATRDSLYEATLTIASEDEALPGAAANADLVVTLQAKLTPGQSVGVGGGGQPLPTVTRLFAPYPNPLRGSSTVHFDVARPTDASLAVYDLTGRRVRTLVSRAFEPGAHSVAWDGRDDAGRALSAGLYFVRFAGDGVAAQTARIAVIR